MEYFYYGLALLSAGGILALILPERVKSAALMLATGAAAVCMVMVSVPVIMSRDALSSNIGMHEPIGEVALVIDPLSAFFIIIISLMSFIGTLYAAGYMRDYYGKKRTITSHFLALSLLVQSLLLVVVIQNAFAFLIAWEIMSLSSFFLIVFENEREDVRRAGVNYLITMHIGMLFITSAFMLLIIKSGSVSFAAFRDTFQTEKQSINLLFLLFFAGFGTKAGFVPFHSWMPRVYPAAPDHVSGIMSGIMSKTGIYGILRIITLIPGPTAEMAYFVLFVSLASGVLGIAGAIANTDIKKIIACSSIENIGIIGIGIGTGLLGMVYHNPMLAILGFSGGLVHVLNHSIIKPLLFYTAGNVLQKTRERDIEKLGGLVKHMPWSAFFFMVGSAAIAGLPPFNGFIGEFFIYWGMISGLKGSTVPLLVSLITAFAILALIGGMALIGFTRVFSVAFLGTPRGAPAEIPREAAWGMRAPLAILVLLIIAIGLAPAPMFAAASGIASYVSGVEIAGEASRVTGTLNNITVTLAAFIVLVIAVYAARSVLIRKKTASYKTWDCGYQAGTARMQYTASSYAGPFIGLIRPILHITETLTPPDGAFPASARYEASSEDKFETLFINPVLRILDRFMIKFTWIQSGRTQRYILYGLVFLVLITLWMMGARQ